jgi:hypothetical protein
MMKTLGTIILIVIVTSGCAQQDRPVSSNSAPASPSPVPQAATGNVIKAVITPAGGGPAELREAKSLRTLASFFPGYTTNPTGKAGGAGPHTPEYVIEFTVKSEVTSVHKITTTSGGRLWSTGHGWLGVHGDFKEFMSKLTTKE